MGSGGAVVLIFPALILKITKDCPSKRYLLINRFYCPFPLQGISGLESEE